MYRVHLCMYALECRLNYWHCLRAVLVAASGPALEGGWGVCVGEVFSVSSDRCFVESGTTQKIKSQNPTVFKN